MKANIGASSTPKLLDFYDRHVLPELFDHLDQAFPEFHWTRGDRGWTASRNPFSKQRETVRGQIVCRQPWGFVADEGTAVSWLAYANGGRRPVDYEIVSAVRKLARMARVDDTSINRPFTTEEIREAHKAERQRELLEAFAAYCHMVLLSPEGQAARSYLQRAYGLDWQHVVESSVGLYTNSADIHDYLASVGFSPGEIHHSKVARDVRLDGRILVPWRDSCGQLRSVVACHSPDGKRGRSGWLYLNGQERPEIFGVDEALRNESAGRDDLILVEGILEVVFFQSLGFTNVASFGTAGRVPNRNQWEQLSKLGVTKATLAFADDQEGRQRAFDAICEANRARRCPELFVVPPDAFASARGPATFTRLNGVGQFREHIERRIHGYHFIAQMIVRKHRPGVQWTDAALVEVLNEAIRFDAVTYRPERALALERFFWPHILQSTGADWDAIRALLARRGEKRARPLSSLGSWDLLDSGRLLHELAERHDSRRLDDFKALICSAANAIQTVQPPEPPKRETPVPFEMLVPRRRRRRRRRQPRQEVEIPRIVPITRPAAMRWPEPPKAPPRPKFAETPPPPRPSLSIPLDVAAVAYQLWEHKGRPENADQQCWYEAEQLVAQALREQNRRRSAAHRDWKSAA